MPIPTFDLEHLNGLWGARHPWAKFVVQRADAPDKFYGRPAPFSYLAWRLTGDDKYAFLCASQVEEFLMMRDHSANTYREHWWEYVWLASRVRGYSDRWASWGANARWHADKWMMALPDQPLNTGGFRISDTDQTRGCYAGLALTDAAFGTDYLTRIAKTGAKKDLVPVGGLDAGPTTSASATG